MSSNPAFCGPALENDNSHPKCGFLAAPAIAHLEGFAKKPDIVESSLDGHLYAWRSNGQPVPGYPVALVDPEEAKAGHAMIAESINDPAIGDLTGSGHDDVVVASNEEYGAGEVGEEVSFAGVTGSAAGSTLTDEPLFGDDRPDSAAVREFPPDAELVNAVSLSGPHPAPIAAANIAALRSFNFR